MDVMVRSSVKSILLFHSYLILFLGSVANAFFDLKTNLKLLGNSL